MNQPLGGSGIDLDIITGVPRKIRTQEEHKAVEELKEQKALQESIAISQELPIVLPIVARQLENRLIEMMKSDPQCQSFLQIIGAFKVKVDIARHVTAKIRRQAMGIVLTSMTDETKGRPGWDTDRGIAAVTRKDTHGEGSKEMSDDVDLNVGNGILGPEDEGSMAFKLARAAEAPQGPSQEELEAARQAEAEAIALEESAAAVALPEGAEESPGGDAPEPPKAPKYASIEEAERAANEAARKMHEALGETSAERKAREALEAELAELKAKELARQEEAARPAAIEANKATYAEALKKIKAIPVTQDDDGNIVYPDDYDDQVAAAWASTAPDPEKIIEEVTRRAEEKEAARRAAAEAAAAEQRAADESARVTADAERLAAEAGLDMTPGSADYRLFYSYVKELKETPDHEYRGKPFEEQVAWATGGVRKILGKKIEMTDAERAAARRTQTRNAVLERGVTRVAPTEPKRQRSMQEILGQTPL